MNKKFIAVATLTTIGAIGISSAFAATPVQNPEQTQTQNQIQVNRDFGGKMGDRKAMINLTEAEKTSLTSMTDTQKKEFFTKKKAESEAKKTAQEAVIDKLLAGTALTADEEKIRQEIIAERAERQAKKTERAAERAKIQTIIDKQKTGTMLAAEEQTLLDQSKNRGGKIKNLQNNSSADVSARPNREQTTTENVLK